MQATIKTSNSAPTPFASKRLIIRPVQLSDTESLLEASTDTHSVLKRWLNWANSRPSIDSCRSFVSSACSELELHKRYVMLGFHRSHNSLVACAELTPNWKIPSFNIGFWVRKQYFRQGYASEIVHGLCDYAITHYSAKRLEIHCSEHNHRCAAVAKRFGFQMEAVLKKHRIDPDGRLCSTRIYTHLIDD